MGNNKRKTVIIDEAGFSRICSAMLEREGYETNIVTDVHQFGTAINRSDVGLVITSYPYGLSLLEELHHAGIPTIILLDHMNRTLMKTLDQVDKTLCYCMVKPLDYDLFRTLVGQIMDRYEESAVPGHPLRAQGDLTSRGGQ